MPRLFKVEHMSWWHYQRNHVLSRILDSLNFGGPAVYLLHVGGWGKGVFSANFVKRVADDKKSEVQVYKQEVVTEVLGTRRVGHHRRKRKRDQGN